LKNPVPETLAGHGLRAITGVFGVLFQLLGNFLKMIIQMNRIIRVTKKNYFQRPKKTIKAPNTPFCYQTGRDRRLPRSGQEILMGSIKRGLWIGQGETIRLNVCYYR
jgi:hypothetical protein